MVRNADAGNHGSGDRPEKENTHARVEELSANEVNGDIHGVSSYYLDPSFPETSGRLESWEPVLCLVPGGSHEWCRR